MKTNAACRINYKWPTFMLGLAGLFVLSQAHSIASLHGYSFTVKNEGGTAYLVADKSGKSIWKSEVFLDDSNSTQLKIGKQIVMNSVCFTGTVIICRSQVFRMSDGFEIFSKPYGISHTNKRRWLLSLFAPNILTQEDHLFTRKYAVVYPNYTHIKEIQIDVSPRSGCRFIELHNDLSSDTPNPVIKDEIMTFSFIDTCGVFKKTFKI